LACEQWSELLSAWVDGELRESERKALEEHLQNCQSCRQAERELRELKRKLEAIPVPPPEPEMWSRVLRHVRHHAQRRRRFVVVKSPTWLAVAASFLLLFGAIAFLWQRSNFSRSDEPSLNIIVGYHADTVSLSLNDNPLCHFIATAELSEAEGHE